jgi:hypothetical protein
VPRITIDQQIAEVEREIGMRHHVYDRRIASGKMTEAQAQKQIQVMAAVLVSLRDYRELLEARL